MHIKDIMYVPIESQHLYLSRYLPIHKISFHGLERIVNTALAHGLHTLDEGSKFVSTGIGNGADGQPILVQGVGNDELLGNVSVFLPLSTDDIEDIVRRDGAELVRIQSGPCRDVVMRR